MQYLIILERNVDEEISKEALIALQMLQHDTSPSTKPYTNDLRVPPGGSGKTSHVDSTLVRSPTTSVHVANSLSTLHSLIASSVGAHLPGHANGHPSILGATLQAPSIACHQPFVNGLGSASLLPQASFTISFGSPLGHLAFFNAHYATPICTVVVYKKVYEYVVGLLCDHTVGSVSS